MTKYEEVAGKIETAIKTGVYQPGDRLPGLRKLKDQFGVSLSTVLEATHLLEDQGRIEARPRSGFYVRNDPLTSTLPPSMSDPPKRPLPVSGQDLALGLAQATAEQGMVNLGAAIPDVKFLPEQGLRRSMTKMLNQSSQWIVPYAIPPGRIELRRQISRKMNEIGCAADPEQIVITNGCQEAFTLGLQAVAQKGDTIAIESPCFYGVLQVISSLGMKALEIPTDPKEGISLPALEMAVDKWPVKALLLVTNFSNPLGHLMPDEKKKELLVLLGKRNIPLIEDDIYGDLGFGQHRPKPARAFDKNNMVVYCSSFSKTIAPALRLGWIDAGRYHQQVINQKFISNLATPSLSQLAVADYLQGGGYDRHLRQVRESYFRQMNAMSQMIAKSFPEGTKLTRPEGGFTLWVGLPEGVDSIVLFQKAYEQKISVAPGPIFSSSQKYRNFLRLSCAYGDRVKMERAVIILGQIVEKLHSQPGLHSTL